MFTLDEEDEETEYGESFKSSIRSNQNGNRIAYIKRLDSSDGQSDDEDDDDLDPDEAFA
jgi:hypothetical protein